MMDLKAAIWYVPGPDGQPAGPYPESQIIEWLRAGVLTARTLCWREGMSDWRPLAEIDEFVEAVLARASDVAKEAPPGQPALADIGKALGKLYSATKSKAKAASLHLSIRQHDRRRNELLLELGGLLIESGSELLDRPPFAEKARELRSEDEAIAQLRGQVEALGNPDAATSDSQTPGA